MEIMRDAGGKMLNDEVELTVQAHTFATALFPQRGVLFLGDGGIEFQGRGPRAYAQVPWDAVSVVRADVYGSFVRSLEVHVQDGRALSFVVSDGAEVLRCLSRHLDRSQLVPARKPLSRALSGFFGKGRG